ncbi:uncharacterized protein [Blastocystis hominis]|uniref:Uncharacterized protein n=1 Tax=Blastocystis hominis TaxID=12968 RepID=D8M0T2_BLAHO|nr:uncharacterized protein [Blastocystis hominis]CBK21671.2 unnamed protein product [Blastocystis hominis]|eukprot:XP_012895719.1 uncharacterized protein [Blastocystis hominis]
MIVNIFFPGIGTIIGAVINEGGCDAGMLIAGVLQLCLTVCAIGWIWSIYVGCKMGCCRD